MVPGALVRGLRNPFQSTVRSAIVVALLAFVIGLCALMVQAAVTGRAQVAELERRVRTLIELREAGAFGTGGFGGDRPAGEEHFTVDTLERVRKIPSARHLARVDEYVYTPQVDPGKPNAYAMLIGVRPGAALRAIGEVDYENARITAGRVFRQEEAAARVAVVGRLYAQQRLGLVEPAAPALAGQRLTLNGQPFEVIGVYATGNDFGDNHVFVPLGAFREAFDPGQKLSKIFVTVDSVTNVDAVVADLRKLPEADVVTAPEAVSTARTTLAGLAAASAYAAALLFAIGAVLVVAVMVLVTRERVREIGTLKAIGASNAEVALQFVAEAAALSGLGGVAAVATAAVFARLLRGALGVPVTFDAWVVGLIAAGSVTFAALGSLYPVVRGIRVSPVEAMRSL